MSHTNSQEKGLLEEVIQIAFLDEARAVCPGLSADPRLELNAYLGLLKKWFGKQADSLMTERELTSVLSLPALQLLQADLNVRHSFIVEAREICPGLSIDSSEELDAFTRTAERWFGTNFISGIANEACLRVLSPAALSMLLDVMDRPTPASSFQEEARVVCARWSDVPQAEVIAYLKIGQCWFGEDFKNRLLERGNLDILSEPARALLITRVSKLTQRFCL